MAKKNFDEAQAQESMNDVIKEMIPKVKEKPKATPKKETKEELKEVPAKNKGGRPKKAVKKSDLYKRTTLYIDKDIKAYFEGYYATDLTGDSFSSLVNRLLDKEMKRIERKNNKV